MQNTIRELKKSFRLAMNGDVSTSMRKSGIDYKLNFGVSLPTIKKIATRFSPNPELADHLFRENVRESKIVATLIWPANEFPKQKAEEWVRLIDKLEIAEQASMNLFAELPYAKELLLEWNADENQNIRMTAHLLLVRLLIKGSIFTNSELEPLLQSLIQDLKSENQTLFSLSLNAIKRLGRNDSATRLHILEELNKKNNELSNAVIEEVETEYSYYA
ncbi:MAG: DNA alkylation repair protein [Bacteroidales bacterium]